MAGRGRQDDPVGATGRAVAAESVPHRRYQAEPSERPREDSNLRARFRKPMLYPLSYEGTDRESWQKRVPINGPTAAPGGSARVNRRRWEA